MTRVELNLTNLLQHFESNYIVCMTSLYLLYNIELVLVLNIAEILLTGR